MNEIIVTCYSIAKTTSQATQVISCKYLITLDSELNEISREQIGELSSLVHLKTHPDSIIDLIKKIEDELKTSEGYKIKLIQENLNLLNGLLVSWGIN